MTDKELKQEQIVEIKAFMQFIEEYIPVFFKSEKWDVPHLVFPEFTKEQWDTLKDTGDWRVLKGELDIAIERFKE